MISFRPSTALSSSSTETVPDGRQFLFAPKADWSLTHVYEVVDGQAALNFEMTGFSFQFYKPR